MAAITTLPILLHANSGGPPPRSTGAPGDLTCAQAGCHGTALSTDGTVEITFPGGLNYTPGVKQRLTVKVTNSAARRFGFQASARLGSNLQNGQAGTFTAGSGTFVQCSDGRNRPTSGCTASAPLEFIQQSTTTTTGTFEFDWTPPTTDVGTVRIYVAGNAANGNGQNDSGDKIYTANYTLNPAAATPKPTISSSGVVDSFTNKALVAPGTWLSIYGTDLATTTREWAGSDFSNNTAPTTLDGVKVSIGGKAAAVRFVSPGQVNVQAPADLGAGPQAVELTNANGTSAQVSVAVSNSAPVLLAPASFSVGGTQYLVALYPDFTTFVGRTNLIAGASFRPAKPGDTIILFGIGFGATTPAIPTGQIVAQLAPINAKVNIRFGETPATIDYAGLAPNFVGLYQFNVRVPNVANGDIPINVDVDGQAIGQTFSLTVQQ